LDVFKWFRRRRESAPLEEDGGEALIRRYGNGAHRERRRRRRDVKRDLVMSEQVLNDEADKSARLDTAIRMLGF
jgi:hypothetical protein